MISNAGTGRGLWDRVSPVEYRTGFHVNLPDYSVHVGARLYVTARAGGLWIANVWGCSYPTPEYKQRIVFFRAAQGRARSVRAAMHEVAVLARQPVTQAELVEGALQT